MTTAAPSRDVSNARPSPTASGSVGSRRPPRALGLVGWCAALPLLVGLIAVLLAGPAQAAPPGLAWSATIADRDVASIEPGDPLVLGAADPTTVEATRIVVTLRNDGPETVRVRSVRLEGRVIGLTFFSYTTGVDLEVAPGASVSRRLDVDLSDLGSQARGLIPARLMLIAPDRSVIDAKPLPVDVHGSLASVYNLFGLAVIGITVLLLISLLWALWQNRLPANRWRRGLRFAAVGLGLGLTLTFGLSALGLLLPSASRWVTLVVVFTAGAFLLGYLLPGQIRPNHTVESGPRTEQRVGQP